MRVVSATEILDMLKQGLPVTELRAIEPLSLESLATESFLSHAIEITGCRLCSLDGVALQFQGSIKIKDSLIESANGSFAFSYFLGGLTIEGCTFEAPVDFQCGGHNKDNNRFSLTGNTYKQFVNFFDCHFEGPVFIKDCTFEKGTNLFGNQGAPYVVTFETPPVIERNTGFTNLSGG